MRPVRVAAALVFAGIFAPGPTGSSIEPECAAVFSAAAGRTFLATSTPVARLIKFLPVVHGCVCVCVCSARKTRRKKGKR